MSRIIESSDDDDAAFGRLTKQAKLRDNSKLLLGGKGDGDHDGDHSNGTEIRRSRADDDDEQDADSDMAAEQQKWLKVVVKAKRKAPFEGEAIVDKLELNGTTTTRRAELWVYATKDTLTVDIEDLEPVRPRRPGDFARVVNGEHRGKQGRVQFIQAKESGTLAISGIEEQNFRITSTAKIQLLHPRIVEEIKNEHGYPCFTWKLGPRAASAAETETLDCTADRVGGLTGFATPRDEADTWPCDRTMFFVCQVNLGGEIPAKMKRIVGDRGLLQIFQQSTGEGWCEDSFVRTLPISTAGADSGSGSDLVPCTALPFRQSELPEHERETYLTDPTRHAPEAYPIVGWDEHLDLPEDCDDENYEKVWRRAIIDAVDDLDEDDRDNWMDHVPAGSLWRHKFGGYGSWTQGGGGTKICEHCGRDHLAQVQFQLVDDSSLPESHPDREVLRSLPFGDNGTVQHTWCPENIEGTHSFEGACG